MQAAMIGLAKQQNTFQILSKDLLDMENWLINNLHYQPKVDVCFSAAFNNIKLQFNGVVKDYSLFKPIFWEGPWKISTGGSYIIFSSNSADEVKQFITDHIPI
jgi:hypothetical protein